MKLQILRFLSLAIFCICMTACGGGDSSPQTPQPQQPVTPPPPNVYPIIGYSVSSTEINEGETVLIDARESNDPDGQVVSISIEHLFNSFFPDLEAVRVNIDAHPSGVFEFVVPELFEDIQATFEITVVDNQGAISSETFYLEFFSRVNDPKIEGFGSAYLDLDTIEPLKLLGVNDFDLLAVEHNSTATPNNNSIIVVANQDELISDRRLSLNSIATEETEETEAIDALFPQSIRFNLQPVTPIQFIALSESGNSVHWFADFELESPYEILLQQSITVSRPCHFVPRTDSGQDFIWIGQRGAGLSVVQLERTVPTDLPEGTSNSDWARGFNSNLLSRAGGERSLCYLHPTVLSERLSDYFPQSNLSDLIAVDYDTNELVLFADDEGNDRSYELLDVIALNTDGVEGLKIIDVQGVGSPNSFPKFLLILMSNGIDNGEHRIVLVEQDEVTNEISQSVLKFEGGAPTQMITPGSIFGSEGKLIDFGMDLFIISSTSNEAVILEDERADLGLDLGPPIYKPAQYLDIGSGAGSGVPIHGFFGGAATRTGIAVSYPEEKRLKVWVYKD